MRLHSGSVKLALVGFAAILLALGAPWDRADPQDLTELGLIGKAQATGGKVTEMGIGENHLKGTVYNLDKIEDIAGVYHGTATETAVVKGLKGGITAKSSLNCIYIHADSATEVVRLSPPAPGGIKIKLVD